MAINTAPVSIPARPWYADRYVEFSFVTESGSSYNVYVYRADGAIRLYLTSTNAGCVPQGGDVDIWSLSGDTKSKYYTVINLAHVVRLLHGEDGPIRAAGEMAVADSLAAQFARGIGFGPLGTGHPTWFTTPVVKVHVLSVKR